MIKITIAGWERGLNKVELNHLLRRHAAYGLSEAKNLVDRLLSGEVVSFAIEDENSARVFCSSAKVIGADCSYSQEVSKASLA